MSARAGGSASKLPIFRSRWPLMNQGVLVRVHNTPLTAHLIDGDWIRGRSHEGVYECIFEDFTEGGNSEAYAWMPRDLIIVESGMSMFNTISTLVHEMAELLDMAKNGHGYETAHSEHANPLEQEYRKRPHRFNEIWMELVAEYREFLASGKSKDRVGP